MPKLLFRLISILSVACMMADPVLASLSLYPTNLTSAVINADRLLKEALSPTLVSAAFFPQAHAQTHSHITRDVIAFRGPIFHFLRAPADLRDTRSHEYFEDGILVVENGKVREIGPAHQLLPKLGPDIPITHYPRSLIMPGFVDTHVHYPQTEMIAAFGEQLLEWLEIYTFPTEREFANKAHAKRVANFFIKELLRNGTTSALVFSTVHKVSVEAMFEEAEKINMRLITGKVLMDRNAREFLLDTAESAYRESAELIRQWHNRGRLRYAVTPRFAPTSTEDQLRSAERLLREFPDVHLQTHLSENRKEVAWVQSLFPWSKHYLDVYDHFNLLGPKSLFAHSIYLSEEEWVRLAETSSAVAFCSSSNLFLGSGFFDLAKSKLHGVNVGIGSDIGAGTSFSIFYNLNEAYKILRHQDQQLSPFEAFYLATLGGARALSLDDKIGNFLPGKEADFVVLNLMATPLQEFRMQTVKTLFDKLFVLMMLGEDRNVEATYIMGEQAHSGTPSSVEVPSVIAVQQNQVHLNRHELRVRNALVSPDGSVESERIRSLYQRLANGRPSEKLQAYIISLRLGLEGPMHTVTEIHKKLNPSSTLPALSQKLTRAIKFLLHPERRIRSYPYAA